MITARHVSCAGSAASPEKEASRVANPREPLKEDGLRVATLSGGTMAAVRYGSCAACGAAVHLSLLLLLLLPAPLERFGAAREPVNLLATRQTQTLRPLAAPMRCCGRRRGEAGT